VDNLSIVPAVGAAGTPEMSTWAMMFIGFGGISWRDTALGGGD
jgi:hypothetical protein